MMKMIFMADAQILYTQAWTIAQLGEALEQTSRHGQWFRQPQQAPRAPADLQNDAEALNRWVMLAAATLGMEAEPVMASFADLAQMVERAAPALLQLPARENETDARFIALVGGGSKPAVLGADLRVYHFDAHLLIHALTRDQIAPYLPTVDALLDAADVPQKRRAHARRTIIEQQMGSYPRPYGWLLRLSPASQVIEQVQAQRLWLPLGQLVLIQLVQLALLVGAWALIGGATFGGQNSALWLPVWALILFTGIPVQLAMGSAQNRFATGLGTLFRQRLLFGTLHLKPDEIRVQGMGQFLERVMMADQVEMLAIGGGLTALLAVFQLFAAMGALALGAGGIAQAATLGVFVLIMGAVGWYYTHANHRWVSTYRQMTNDLVERMVGHRTRLAQQDPAEWHEPEDAEMERYLTLSGQFDRAGVLIEAMPRLWIVVGIAGLIPAFLAGELAVSALAISLGGILLASNALTTIAEGLNSVVNMSLAWNQVGPLFNAASRYQAPPPAALQITNAPATASPILRARELVFRYRPHSHPILDEINLDIFSGERILLEGPSGGGKTTLAAVLAGLRDTESGLMLLDGLDRRMVENEETPRRIAMAPQFHENHIFTATFGFNLLMGRRWPPEPQDIAEAEALCDELGLRDLLNQMPSGMQQMVGESGWQLSHGEASRVFIARALLQRAAMVIMDESFGALDPENLERALRCALGRAQTLVVIAHP